jgi:hypothetical protein
MLELGDYVVSKPNGNRERKIVGIVQGLFRKKYQLDGLGDLFLERDLKKVTHRHILTGKGPNGYSISVTEFFPERLGKHLTPGLTYEYKIHELKGGEKP